MTKPCATLQARWGACREVDVHAVRHPRWYGARHQWHVCCPWIPQGNVEPRAEKPSHRAPCTLPGEAIVRATCYAPA